MSKTKRKPTPRTPAPQFTLTTVERMLLILYRTVGIETRAKAGCVLYDAWTHTPDSDKEDADKRYKAAEIAFNAGDLYVSAFDDLIAGGYRRVEEIEGER